jgi:hypothetical protein
MATIGNYGAALGDTLKQSAGGIVKGFGYGLKGAALSEMPGLVAGFGAFSALSKKANSIGQAKAALAQGSSKTPTSSSSVVGGNPFAQMVQQLAQINANTAATANVAKATAKAEQYKMMFDEEKAREQAQQNQALIDAIKNSGLGRGGAAVAGDKAESAGGGLLSNILGSALGGILGTAILSALVGLRKKIASFIAQLVLSAALMFGGKGLGGKLPGLGSLGKGALKGAKIAGKIGARFIPGLGWVLLAADIAEAGSYIYDQTQKSGKTELTPDGDDVVSGISPEFGGPAPVQDDTPSRNENYSNEGRGRNLSMIDRGRVAMGIPVGGTSPTSSVSGGGNSSSPQAQRTQVNQTSGLVWRVPLLVPYTVTSEFGVKSAIRNYKEHDGIDLAAPAGNFVVAAADGLVTRKDYNDRSGNFVVVDHLNGMTTTYVHLAYAYDKVGQKVKIGDPIGVIGSTGRSTGVHLHFMVRRGTTPINPRTVISFGALNKESKPAAPATAPTPPGDSKAPTKAPAKRGNFDGKRAGNVPGFKDQSNRNIKGSAVKAYYDALSAGKTEEEAKAIATKVAGENVVAKAAIDAIVPVATNTALMRTSATPLIEMGDAGVAESMQNKSPAWVDAYLRKVTAKGYYTERETNKRTQEVIRELGGIKENTRITAKELKSNRITMSKGKFTRPEELLARANKQFTDSLQRQLTKTISGTLMKALYPGGYKNVSQRTASGQLYRGEQLNKLLGVTPALTKLGTSIFGKQYGPAFGQIFSKAATSYMEVGARSVAKGIFGSMGMNDDQSNILGGQILGNLAKGTKQGKLTALEQILFGVSGGQVALGPETIFAKYGFASPQDGISYMANVLGSSIMGPVNSGLGTTPLNMRNMDPRMRTMGAFGGYGGEYGGSPTGMPSAGTLQAAAQNNPLMQVNQQGMVVLADNVPKMTKDIANQLNAAKEAEIAAQERWIKAEAGSDERSIAQRQISEAQYEQQIRTNQLLQSRGTGSGTTIGGAGGGGFFTGDGVRGSFSSTLAEVGNMGLDFGKAAITQKVVQSMGIKNPYMALLASFAVNKGVSYLGGKAFDMFSGTEIGKNVVGSFSNIGNTLSNAYGTYAPTWLGGYDAATMADLELGRAMTANAGGTAASSPLIPGFETFAPYLPYIPAVLALAKGDVGAAAGLAAGAYAGTVIGSAVSAGALGAEIGAFGGPVGIVAGFVIGSILGSFFSSSSSPPEPNPAIWRVIRTRGNNDINGIVDLQPPREATPKGWPEFADALIRVAFNATKEAEVQTKEMSPFDFVVGYIDKNSIIISLRTGDPNSGGNDLNLGKPGEKSFDSGKAASQIVKHVSDAFKAAYAAKADAVDKASKVLNSLTFGKVSTALIKDLTTGANKIDTSITKGVYGGTTAEDLVITTGMANKPQAATSGDEYSSGTNPMVYSMKEGKYVEAPFTTETVTVNDGEGGTYQVNRKVYDTSILMYDKNGNPIYDKNKSGGIDLADIVTPTLSTTSGTIVTGGTTTTGGSGTGAGGDVTVNTVADNSQTNNQSVNTYYTSLLSKSRNPIRDASVNAGILA